MTFKEILPAPALRPYIKGFYFYASDTATPFEDIVFPSGAMEIIFNLGDGSWKVREDNSFYTTPAIEVWGQITKPLAIRSLGKNRMPGIRFFPHSAAYFFSDNIAELNNKIIDGADLFGPVLSSLHERLLGTSDLSGRIMLLEDYLLDRLAVSEKKHAKIKFIGEIADHLKSHCNNERLTSVSIRNNISTRRLSQLFSQYTGLAPKLFSKINRFQYSLNLINAHDQKLTSIAYDAGYFDQSHFIREFKSFTGVTPTSFSSQVLPINQLLANN